MTVFEINIQPIAKLSYLASDDKCQLRIELIMLDPKEKHASDTRYGKVWIVYHVLGKAGWSTVVVNETRQIPNGNFHGDDALVPFPRLFAGG